MPDDGGVVRRVVWREVLPWLVIFRCFRISISLPVLFFATLGWLLTLLGPRIAGTLFLDSPTEDPVWAPAPGGLAAALESAARGDSLLTAAASISDPVRFVYLHFSDPFLQVFNRDNTIRETAYYVFSGLWNVVVWAFFAGAITRITAVQLGREQRVDLRTAGRFAGKQYVWSVLAPLFPLLGVLLAAAPIALLGLVMRVGFGVAVAAVLWPLVLLGGLIMTVLLLGLAAGWPLMWPTISSEEHGDAFEAFSRSFSYVFQRPLHYLGYILLAVAVGWLGWLLVSGFSEALIELCLYAASWGAGAQRINEISQGPAEGLLWFGSSLIAMFNWLVRAAATAFNFSFFFCVSTAIYLLMRRSVDQNGFDDVYLEDEQHHFSLPPVDVESAPEKADEEKTDVAKADEQE